MNYDTEKYLNEAEAALFLGVSIRTLQGWRLRGGGPRYHKLSRAVRYTKADLVSWADSRAVFSTSQTIPSDHEGVAA